jgi:hypothetical protein
MSRIVPLRAQRHDPAHGQDRAVAGAAGAANGRADAVAVARIGDGVARDAALLQERPDVLAGRVDAGLVETAAVGVHQRLDQAEDRVALARDPVDHLALRRAQLRHEVLRTRQAPSHSGTRTAPRQQFHEIEN